MWLQKLFIARSGGPACAISSLVARTLSGGPPIEAPPNLVQATKEDTQRLLPFSWQIGQFRHRTPLSADSGVQVFYKARPKPLVPSFDADYTDTPRSPSDSYLQLVFPFSTSPALRDQYRRFVGDRPRWGILLEDLDTLAGDIAALHAGLQGGKVAPVTAVVDRFNMMTSSVAGEQVDLRSDLRMDGQVTWVGRSSMEVLITLSSRPGNAAPSSLSAACSTNVSKDEDALPSTIAMHQGSGAEWRFEGFARFVMAMRDSVARRAVPVAPLALQTECERRLFEHGGQHHVWRKQKRESHWRNQPPSEAEVRLIHQLAVSNLDSLSSTSAPCGLMGAAAAARAARAHAFTAPQQPEPATGGGGAAAAVQLQDGGSGAPLPPVPMHTTELCSTQLMHSQDRNHFSYIFGGHLMRLAFEHAYTTAAMHAGEWCDPVSMEDVVFISSVPIGCILELRAKVVHTRRRHLRVLVEAVLLYPGRRDQVTSNLFSFLFLSPSVVPPVLPTSVVEALEFVLGRRQAEEQEQHDRLASGEQAF